MVIDCFDTKVTDDVSTVDGEAVTINDDVAGDGRLTVVEEDVTGCG